ncbi:MAG: hypothetical protein Q4A70_04220 [Candidatus Saccharibacteria bacterium]|nr:hypothetical protein [Candidatus Saccharibacteria bacterium]
MSDIFFGSIVVVLSYSGGAGGSAPPENLVYDSVACAGLAGEARTSPDYNQDISQAGRGQPAKYPLLSYICGKIGSSDII